MLSSFRAIPASIDQPLPSRLAWTGPESRVNGMVSHSVRRVTDLPDRAFFAVNVPSGSSQRAWKQPLTRISAPPGCRLTWGRSGKKI